MKRPRWTSPPAALSLVAVVTAVCALGLLHLLTGLGGQVILALVSAAYLIVPIGLLIVRLARSEERRVGKECRL